MVNLKSKSYMEQPMKDLQSKGIPKIQDTLMHRRVPTFHHSNTPKIFIKLIEVDQMIPSRINSPK